MKFYSFKKIELNINCIKYITFLLIKIAFFIQIFIIMFINDDTDKLHRLQLIVQPANRCVSFTHFYLLMKLFMSLHNVCDKISQLLVLNVQHSTIS